jgi:hypothetical protein
MAIRWRTGAERAVRRVRAAGLRGWLSLERDTLQQIAKTALAAALSWSLAVNVLGSEIPALAPLGAIIIVQVTVYQTIARALQYVVGVVLGVGVALALAWLLGVQAWSIGLVIFGALAIGHALHLGTQANQVAISALLVLSLGEGYGAERAYDAALGAIVGVLVNFLIAPPTYVGAAGRTLRRVAEDLADLCHDVGERLPAAWTAADARGWLGRARDIDADVREAAEALERAEESVRYNLRRGEAEALARYSEALTALEHGTTQVRGLVRTLTELASGEGSWRAQARPVLVPLGRLLLAVREVARGFGALQTDEPHQWAADRRVLGAALAAATEAHDEAARRLREMAGGGRALRLLASVLVDAERLLRELDPDHGEHTGAVPSNG